MQDLKSWALLYAERGWPVVPLWEPVGEGVCACPKGAECRAVGKHPRIVTGPDHRNASVDPGQIDEWWSTWPNANIGIITGAASGVVVVDVDPKNEGARPEELPDTVQCKTGSGGTHDYFVIPDGVPMPRKSVLFKGVDFQATGGLVVAPPSLHSSGERYEWTLDGDPRDRDPEPLPPWVLEARSGDRKAKPGPPALDSEPLTPGNRNVMLTRIAGALRRQGADANLIEAALQKVNADRCTPPLDASEVRSIAKSVTRYVPTPDPAGDKGRKPALVPGEHQWLDDGQVKAATVREDGFAADVLGKFEPGTVYRRAGVAGTIDAGEFLPCTTERMILLTASQVALESRKVKQGRGGPVESRKFELVTPQRANIIRAHAGVAGSVRDVRRVVPFPVFVGDDCRLVTAGWDEASGTRCLYRGEIEIPEDPAEFILGALVDWPFATEADRSNAVAMLLAIILRPAITGNMPMFLVEASLERTGKTKLASELVGGIFLGHPTPAGGLAAREEEVEKRILASLMQGRPILSLDNIGRKIASESLARLLTSTVFEGRLLGSSREVQAPNEAVIIGTGNNVTASGEIAKRIIPIRLHPATAAPELRTDFMHPDLGAFVRENRGRLLGGLVGMVERWIECGRPDGRKRLGGYEGFSRIVGGVLEVNGCGEWLDNRESWAEDRDDEKEELDLFVDTWWKRWGPEKKTAFDLVALAKELDVFSFAYRREGEADNARSLTKGVLSSLRDRPVGEFIVRTGKVNRRTAYRLVRASESVESDKSAVPSRPVADRRAPRQSWEKKTHDPAPSDDRLPTVTDFPTPPKEKQTPHNKGALYIGAAAKSDSVGSLHRDFWAWASAQAAKLGVEQETVTRPVFKALFGVPFLPADDPEAEAKLDAWVEKNVAPPTGRG